MIPIAALLLVLIAFLFACGNLIKTGGKDTNAWAILCLALVHLSVMLPPLLR